MLSEHDNRVLTETGPGTPMGEVFRRFWTPVLLKEELPVADCPPVAVRILSEDLVAFRDSNGKVGLVDAHCAHRHAFLFWGRNEEYGLRCTFHGWKYDIEGNCVDMPNEPAESRFKEKIKITAYPTKEMGGVIWAYMGPKELMPPELPRFEGSALPESQWRATKEMQLNNWAQAVEGGIDSSHVSYLHMSFDRLRAGAKLPLVRGDLGPDEYYALMGGDRSPRFFVAPTDFGLWIAARRNADHSGYFWRQTAFFLPSWTMIAGSGRSRGGHFWVPIDDTHTWTYSYGWSITDESSKERHKYTSNHDGRRPDQAVPDKVDKDLAMWEIGTSNAYMPVRNQGNNYLINREAQRGISFTGIGTARAQDRSIQESMGQVVPREKEHLGTTDKGIIQFRRLMLRLARDLQEGQEPMQPWTPEVYNPISCSVVVDRSLPWPDCLDPFTKARV